MGFRESLDLTGIIDRYEAFGGRAPAVPNYMFEGQRPEDPMPTSIFQPAQAAGSGEDPALVGTGPSRASTSRVLATSGPLLAWDPNRYYRDLEIPWPYVDATRMDLRQAYQAVDGQSSPRLTYCFKQLLNPAVRAEYDALPLGEQYLNDIYVQDELRALAAKEAGRRTESGVYATAEDVLDDWGMKIVPEEEDTPEEIVDSDHLKRFDECSDETVGGGWDYSFYLWKTTKWDVARLAAWQAALISVIDQELSPSIVVGMMGNRPHDYAIAEVAGQWVVFLNRDGEVTLDLAVSATTTLHTQICAKQDAPHKESRSNT